MRYMSKLKAEQNVANVVFLLNKNLFLNSSFLIKQKDYKKQQLWEFKLAVDINFCSIAFEIWVDKQQDIVQGTLAKNQTSTSNEATQRSNESLTEDQIDELIEELPYSDHPHGELNL